MRLNQIILMIGVAAMTISPASGWTKTRKDAKSLPLPVGVVEGFYGRPWSHEDRLEIIRFMGTIGMNHYCYAPKDDPYHRKKWREPYPPEEFQKLRELISACKRANVTFCFAVSPGLDIEYSNPAEFQKLVAKLEPLAREGVRCFALFFDDVPSTFTRASDARAFHSFAEAHARLANDLYAAAKQWNPATTLIVCPTEYYHSDPTPYLVELSSKLRPEISLVWTGTGVFSRQIDSLDLLRIRQVVGRKPFLWDNYPVNDCYEGQIFLGPLRQRTPLIGLNLAGYWSNPMNEAELSKIALMTAADFFRSPETYNPETSWRSALKRVGGERAYPYMLRLADLMSGSVLSGDEGRVLCSLMADYFESPTPATVASLREYLQQLLDLEHNLDRTLRDRRLFMELRPSLKRLRLHVRNLQTALRIEEVGTTSAEAQRLRQTLTDGLKAVDSPVTAPQQGSPEWERLLGDESTVFPGNVADEIFAYIQQSFFSRWTRETSPTMARLMAAPPAWRGQFGEFAMDGDTSTSYASCNPWKAGECLAFDLGAAKPAGSSITVLLDGVEKWKAVRWPELAVEISVNGTQWSQAGTVHGGQQSVKAGKAFRFVRLLATRDTDTRVVVREISISEH